MATVELERAGTLGALADEIDQLDQQLRGIDDEAAETIRNLPDGPAARDLALTVRTKYESIGQGLRRSREYALQKRADLLTDRRELLRQVEACRKFLQDNAEEAAQCEKAQWHVQQAIGLLDRKRQWNAIQELGRVPITLPAKMNQIRGQLAAAEQRLIELGKE